MDITEQRDGQTCVLALAGKLDSSSAAAFSTQAVALCGSDIRGLLIDLQQVDYLTSAGFRALMAIKRRADQATVRFALCGLSDIVRELFEIGGLLGAFGIYPDRETALAAVDTQD